MPGRRSREHDDGQRAGRPDPGGDNPPGGPAGGGARGVLAAATFELVDVAGDVWSPLCVAGAR
ncbi:hypothetical protein [Micromonospora sp. NPDC049662]|uniref:hypothetical protein n=1 Tax=Micromonospora sp. NPDC049662 TaxID=3155397 RepID=UPI003436F9A2